MRAAELTDAEAERTALGFGIPPGCWRGRAHLNDLLEAWPMPDDETPTRPEMFMPCPECPRGGPCALCKDTREVSRKQWAGWHARRAGRPPKE